MVIAPAPTPASSWLETYAQQLLKQLSPALLKAYPQLHAEQLSTALSLKLCAPQHGDLSSTLPLKLAARVQTSPSKLADKVQTLLSQPALSALIAKVTVIAPGFCNITLTTSAKSEALRTLLKTPIDCPAKADAPKILLEYISANPTGPLHIGHGRWAAYGSTLAKILRANGRSVTEEFYVNDGGSQIELLRTSVAAIRNDKPIPKDGYHGAYLRDFKDSTVDPVAALLTEQQETLWKTNVPMGADKLANMDKHFFRESSLRTETQLEDMLTFLTQHKLSYQAEGATWFAAAAKGSDEKDRVIVKADGSYTYFFLDILYHFNKIKRGYAHLIDILGADHHGYKERITSACQLLYRAQATTNGTPKPALKVDVIIGQLANITRGGKPIRMSKRTGNLVELSEVLIELGADALRYFLIHQDIHSTITFDIETAKAKTMDNPVYYIQYAHARIQSVFKKACDLKLCDETFIAVAQAPYNEDVLAADPGVNNFNFELIEQSPTNTQILLKLLTFKDELQLIAESYQVHHLPRFLHELAGLFHKRYNETAFLDPETPERSAAYLRFLLAIDKVLVYGLALMGIKHPDSMQSSALT